MDRSTIVVRLTKEQAWAEIRRGFNPGDRVFYLDTWWTIGDVCSGEKTIRGETLGRYYYCSSSRYNDTFFFDSPKCLYHVIRVKKDPFMDEEYEEIFV